MRHSHARSMVQLIADAEKLALSQNTAKANNLQGTVELCYTNNDGSVEVRYRRDEGSSDANKTL